MNIKALLYPSLAGYIATTIAFTLASPARASSHPAAVPAPSAIPFQMAQTTSLTGSWKLANMTAGDLPMPMLPASDSVPTIEFANGRVAGTGGCNRFMGGYEVQGEQLSIGPLASTFMACEEAVMAQESLYLKALQGAQRYEVNYPAEGTASDRQQGQLTVFYQTEEGSGVLRFVSQTVSEPASEPVQEPVQDPVQAPAQAPVRGLW